MSKKQYKLGSGISQWLDGKAQTVTFIVTEDCNLRCKYCYEVHKNNKNRMSFETAKKAVDYVLGNPDIFSSKGVIWDFIGGEPLLEIDLIDKIIDYIKLKTFKMNHPWFAMNVINFSTNGTLYDEKKVQRFIAKNKDKCSFGLTIDGTKAKHDLQRVYPDGSGSYEDVVKNAILWIKQFPTAATKVTFSSDDLKYLKESIIHLWKLGIKTVPANVVFEDVWKDGDDLIFEQQLKELADYIIDNKLWDEYNVTLFDDKIGTPLLPERKEENRCGTGNMIAVDGKGDFYQCLRYSSYSLQNCEGSVIGNVDDGIDFDKIRPFIGLTYVNQLDDECKNCEIAEGCTWCQAHCYDESKGETNYKRSKSTCKMHKASYRANEYYWGRLREEYNIVREMRYPKSKNLYFIMDDNCVEYCNYKSVAEENIMPEEIIKKGFKFAEENFFTPIILQSKDSKNIKNLSDYSYYEGYEIYSENNEFAKNNQKKFRVFTPENLDNETKELGDTCVLNVEAVDIRNLSKYINKLLPKYNRINLNIKYDNRDFDVKAYEEELFKISDVLSTYIIQGKYKSVNRITDDFSNSEMDNCNAGEKNFALAPNGKIYPCPKFYFEDKDSYVGDLDNGINVPDEKIFNLDKAPICQECDMYHCDRCVYLNKKFTYEYNTPAHIECAISIAEKKATYRLYKLVKDIDSKFKDIKVSNDFTEPMEFLLNKRKRFKYKPSVFCE